MSLENNNILAVIPARGGSKGVPRKNLREIHGKSLIEYASDCIKQITWIDASVISTEDEEIAAHAKTIGLDMPGLRPSELAIDHAKSIDAWIHSWLASEKYYNKIFDISILLEPTSPTRTAEDIHQAVQLLISSNASSVVTVSKSPGHYTPHKTLKLAEDGSIAPFLPDGMKYTIRQQIPDYYHRNGICYAVTRKSLIDEHNLMEHNCLPLIINRHIVNIDEEVDIKLAEYLISNP